MGNSTSRIDGLLTGTFPDRIASGNHSGTATPIQSLRSSNRQRTQLLALPSFYQRMRNMKLRCIPENYKNNLNSHLLENENENENENHLVNRNMEEGARMWDFLKVSLNEDNRFNWRGKSSALCQFVSSLHPISSMSRASRRFLINQSSINIEPGSISPSLQ